MIKTWLGEHARMKPETDAFFLSERRRPLSRKTAWLAIRTYGELAGLLVDQTSPKHPLRWCGIKSTVLGMCHLDEQPGHATAK